MPYPFVLRYGLQTFFALGGIKLARSIENVVLLQEAICDAAVPVFSATFFLARCPCFFVG